MYFSPMSEAKRKDKILRQLKSGEGFVDMESLISLQPEKKDKEFARVALKEMLNDGIIECDTGTITPNSKVKLTIEGNEFLYKGGYKRKERKPIVEDKRPEPLMPYLITILIFGLLVAFLYYVLPVIWAL